MTHQFQGCPMPGHQDSANVNKLHRIFPLFATLQGYHKKDLRADAVAGVTTAVLLVPQGMAYALLAGLPPIHGVYAALVPAIAYAILGTSRQLSVGPVALDSLLVAAGVGTLATVGSDAYVSAAVLLALLVGTIQVAMGLLKTGFMVNFLSVPVISGFTSAAAIVIGLSQAKFLLGVELQGSSVFIDLLPQLVRAVPEADPTTVLLGALSAVLIVGLKRFASRLPAALIAVVVGAVAVRFFDLSHDVAIVGDVPRGLPSLELPTLNWEMMKGLLPTALTIALVSFTESISVGKAYAKKNRHRIIPDRELVALGFGNAIGSLFGGYPVAGGLSRTAVNVSAGARTPVAALITSAVVGLSLLFFTPWFYFMPKAALAAIILTAVVGLVDLEEVRHLHRVKREDLVLLVITFVATLALGILPGIGIGVSTSIVWFVIRTTRPHVAVLGRVPGTKLFKNIHRNRGLITYEGVIAVRMDAQFYFGNVAFLRSTLERLEDRLKEPLRAVVLDFSAINSVDSSAEAALADMVGDFESRGVKLYLAGVKGPIRDVLESSGLWERLGQAGRCLTVHEAISLIDAPARRGKRVTVPPPSTGARASGSSARL